MKIAMIGTQGHQGYLLNGLKGLPDCTLVTIAKGSPGEDISAFLKTISENFKIEISVYDDWRAMLDKEAPDVVSVAPIFSLHQQISIECLKRGINVMCEKPVAMNLNDLDELENAYDESKAKFVGMHAMRYQPNFRAIKKSIDEGLIGRPILINSQKSYYFTTTRPEFYKKRSQFGSTLCWVASHALDWTYWFMGPIKHINAYHTTFGNKGYDECESSGVISFEFEDIGTGCVNFDFLKAGKDTAARDACRIAGEKGVLEALEGKAFITTHDEARRELELPAEESFFKAFVDAITGENQCLLDAKETFAVTKLCLLARESADNSGVRKIVNNQ